jgi:cytochrome c
MLPHPQHTTDEVTIMLRWVFGLEKGKGAIALVRGLSGELTAPKDPKAAGLVLEATYTDAGRPPAGSLGNKATVTLRSRRFEAESGEVRGPKISGDDKASGKRVIGSINDQHFVKFPAVNLAEVGGFNVRAASGNVGGTIELRSGSPDGALLAAFEVPNTGGWDKWIEKTAPALNLPTIRTDVYVVFVNPGKGGLMNLDWVQFNPR